MNIFGDNLSKLRKQYKLSQEQLAKELNVDRSYISKIESGKCPPPEHGLKIICDLFKIDPEVLLDQISILVIDTSAFMKNPGILNKAMNKYEKILIPDIVIKELNRIKDKHKKGNSAWLALCSINEFKKKNIIEIVDSNIGYNNDEKIINCAKELATKYNAKVFILHNDIDFSIKYKDSILLKDFLKKKNISTTNFNTIYELDTLYLENWNSYDLDPSIDLNTYLQDGMTLLIHCIRSNNKNKYKKLHFLIKHGADVNKTDNHKYYFTPLLHCIQKNDIKAFNILMNYKADYNKGSFNENRTEYTRASNEGNTPLMVACWHNRIDFVKILLNHKDLSINQQDGNGYTALHKCAIKGHRLLYDLLIKNNIDTRIRDRQNKTAKEYLNVK